MIIIITVMYYTILIMHRKLMHSTLLHDCMYRISLVVFHFFDPHKIYYSITKGAHGWGLCEHTSSSILDLEAF